MIGSCAHFGPRIRETPLKFWSCCSLPSSGAVGRRAKPVIKEDRSNSCRYSLYQASHDHRSNCIHVALVYNLLHMPLTAIVNLTLRSTLSGSLPEKLKTSDRTHLQRLYYLSSPSTAAGLRDWTYLINSIRSRKYIVRHFVIERVENHPLKQVRNYAVCLETATR